MVAPPSYTSGLRLFALYVVGCITGGLIPGQAIFTQLFIDAGLFSDVCESGDVAPCYNQFMVCADIMTSMSTLVMFFMLPAGILFDSYGGQIAGTLGCAILFLGLLVLITLLVVRDEWMRPYEPVMFTVGVLLCDLGSYTNNVAFFAFLWHLPGYQALLLSLSNAVYQVSSFLPILLQQLMRATGLGFTAALGVYALVVIGAAVVCYLVTPGLLEYRQTAAQVLGVPLPRKRATWRDVNKQLSGAWAVLRKDWTRHAQFNVLAILGMVPPSIYTAMATPFGDELFRDDEEHNGKQLALLFNQVNGVLGIVVGPLAGTLADALGGGKPLSSRALPPLIALTAALSVVLPFIIAVPSYALPGYPRTPPVRAR